MLQKEKPGYPPTTYRFVKLLQKYYIEKIFLSIQAIFNQFCSSISCGSCKFKETHDYYMYICLKNALNCGRSARLHYYNYPRSPIPIPIISPELSCSYACTGDALDCSSTNYSIRMQMVTNDKSQCDKSFLANELARQLQF